MKAIQLEKPQTFRIVDIPEPEAPSPGEALVRVHRVGICGTDYAGYLGTLPMFTYPRIPGHELGVEVLAVGSGVSHVRVGDRCVVEPYINDPGSWASRQGHPNCCENLRVLGVTMDGGMRSRFLLPARKLHPAPGLTFDQAALVETLAVGAHAVARGGCGPGQTVVVIGAGPVGLSVMEALRRVEARTVAIDSAPARLDFVRQRLKLVEVIQAKGDATDVQQLEQLTNGRLAECVIDTTGNPRSVGSALKFAGHAGRLVFVGISNQELTFPQALWHRRELSVMSSRNAVPSDFQRVIEWISSGQLETRHWVTHTAGMDEMLSEFGRWLNPAAGVVRALVRVDL